MSGDRPRRGRLAFRDRLQRRELGGRLGRDGGVGLGADGRGRPGVEEQHGPRLIRRPGAAHAQLPGQPLEARLGDSVQQVAAEAQQPSVAYGHDMEL
eukprot:2278058-Prymnesium_polylepis.1